MNDIERATHVRSAEACAHLRQSAYFEAWLKKYVLDPLMEAERILHDPESTDAQLRAANIRSAEFIRQRDGLAQDEEYALNRLKSK